MRIVIVVALVAALTLGFGAGFAVSSATNGKDVTVINKTVQPKPPLDILK